MDSIAFTLSKRLNQDFLRLFYKNSSYLAWIACLCSLLSIVWLFVTEQTFLAQKSSLFSYSPHSKNKFRNLENICYPHFSTFHYTLASQ